MSALTDQASKIVRWFAGHAEGLAITNDGRGNFSESSMSDAELAAREPAALIASEIYRHANQAGVCYAELHALIAKAIQAALDGHARELLEWKHQADCAGRDLAAAVTRANGLEPDAGRFRWLRDNWHGFRHYREATINGVQFASLERDIDAAIAKAKSA